MKYSLKNFGKNLYKCFLIILFLSSVCRAAVEGSKDDPAQFVVDVGGANSGHLVNRQGPDGRTYLLWVQYVKGSLVVRLSTNLPGQTGWTKPINISDETLHSYTPDIAFDDAGGAMIVWVQGTRDNVNLMYSREIFADGKLGEMQLMHPNFSKLVKPGPYSTTILSGAYTPRVLYSPSEKLWKAVWSQWDGWADRIFYSERSVGKTWSKALVLDTTRADAYAPDMCQNSQGQVFVAWYQFDSTKGVDRPFYSIRTPDTGKWSAPVSPGLDHGASTWPIVACGQNTFEMFWQQSDGDKGFRLWMARIPLDVKKAPESILLQADGFTRGEATAAAVLNSSADTREIAWCAEHEHHQTVDYIISHEGQKLGSVQSVYLKDGSCFNPALSHDQSNNTVVAWTEEDKNKNIYINSGVIKKSILDKFVYKVASLLGVNLSKKVQGVFSERLEVVAVDTLPKDKNSLTSDTSPIPPRFTTHVRPRLIQLSTGAVQLSWIGVRTDRYELFTTPIAAR